MSWKTLNKILLEKFVFDYRGSRAEGTTTSMPLMKEIDNEHFPVNERYFGLHNFGNTCYCNSILQALFFCPPFRDKVLQYRLSNNGKHSNSKNDSLLNSLSDLFHSISNQKKKCGVLQPKKFVARLRKEHESFDNYMQHDAHELFNLLLNSIHITLLKEKKAEAESKKLQEQKSASGNPLKKQRSSFFSRRKKEKYSQNLTNSIGITALSENGVPPTAARNSLETVPSTDCSESMSSAEYQLNDDNSINLDEFAAEKVLNPPLFENLKHLNGNTTANETVYSNKTVSFLSRIRQSKKVAVSSKSSDTSGSTRAPSPLSVDDEEESSSWIHDIFQGTFTSITHCLNCETVNTRDEDFLDLSVDIEQNTSITHCLRAFSNRQMLDGEHKYYCENCKSKQEAHIQMQIKKLPKILALHLKRFKYCDTLKEYTKLSYRVVFPFELRLFNTTDDASNAERLYDLIAVVVHCGSGPYRGHYVSIVKSHGMWLLFDDDSVEKLEPSGMEDFYGVTADKNSESGYILFYQCKDL